MCLEYMKTYLNYKEVTLCQVTDWYNEYKIGNSCTHENGKIVKMANKTNSKTGPLFYIESHGVFKSIHTKKKQ